MTGEDFLTVSNRGRMAFFLCCAEQALIKEERNSTMHPRWTIVINKFWQILNWENIDDMEDFIDAFMPGQAVFKLETYTEYLLEIEQDGIASSYDDETEFLELKLIFASNSMIKTFLKSMDRFYANGIYGAPDEPRTVKLINQYIAYIETNNLTLPPIENFQQFARTGDFNFGAPITREMVFNGPTG